MDYSEAIEYMNSTAWFAREPGLSRISALLEKLGRPQDRLKFVHIAGTNGKGSCAAMTAAVMKACGYRTGLFTSPYLFRFNERMQINGKQIEDAVLAEIVSAVKAASDSLEDKPTAFELMTACALKWFSDEKCDIVVLEAGLGGKNDATNVIDAPEASVIMNIGLDHTKVLGGTVEEIAAEKAGIIKSGCACVMYSQSPSVTDIIKGRCSELSSGLHIADFSQLKAEFDSLEGQVFSYKSTQYALPLLGKCQLKNASVVLELVEVLRGKGWNLEQGDVEHGLYSVSWPGRFELVADDPPFIVDGGHNPQCAETVAENLENYFADVPKILLIGLLSDKDYTSVADILAPLSSEFVCITPPCARALPAEELASLLGKYGKKVQVAGSIEDGVAAAQQAASELGGMVCATGSLYSVGKIRSCFNLF